MLQLRTILNTKMNKKGFTLAELLVVVAIIAILVAVSIPIFSGKLTEARKNTDLANVRAAKAAAVTEYLSNEKITNQYYNADNGAMVADFNSAKPKDTTEVGYNQAKQGTLEPKHAVVKIVIEEAVAGKPTVTATWTDK